MILISLCSCLLLYQKPLYVVYYSTRNHYMLFITLPETTLYVVYYSTRNHYMLFITLPETTICCLLLYQKPLYVVYYSNRNHYMLFITLPETTICCLLLYQKPLYVVYYSTRNHYMLFIVSVSVFFASSLYLDFRVLDITLTMFTLDFTFIPQRIRLVVLRYRYHNLSSI